MIKCIILFKRKPGLSREEFLKHWKETHAKVCVENPFFQKYNRKYVQNYPIQAGGLTLMQGPKSAEADRYDGIVEVWMDSIEDLQRMLKDPDPFQNAIREDENKFVDTSDYLFFVVEEKIVYDVTR